MHKKIPKDTILDQPVLDFLRSKPPFSVELFNRFNETFQSFGPVETEATKTTIAFGSEKRICHIYQFSRKFISGVFYFDQPYEDNLCFHIISKAGEKRYNHHFRLYSKEDLNEEVVKYMLLAYKSLKA